MSTHFVATPRTDTREPAAPLPGAPAAIGSSTAVLLPAARTSRARASFTLPEAALSAPDATAASPSDDEISRPDGYVVFAVGDACFAVPVDEVRAVIRTERLDLLPGGERPRYGRGVALVDVRGRAIPVVDLRSDASSPGEVLLPLYRHHVGLVVDRVVSVSSARELVPEPDGLPDVLPAYAQGVLRPVDGGPPVLLVALPDAELLQS